jgi:endonuclease-8
MEGPSLVLAAQQLRPFKKKIVLEATGNTKLDKSVFVGKEVRDIFSWGKHLVFQFDSFALRIHFMLFGTFEAEIDGVWVTGDYRRARVPRLAFRFENGVVNTYNCSLKLIESRNAKRDYDFSSDIMSRKWDPAAALKRVKKLPDAEIADVLLDQNIFAGVGNIIKNEVLSLQHIAPQTKVGELSAKQMKAVIAEARGFSQQFLRWRRKFVLKKNLKAHRRALCPHCAGRLTRAKTGARERWSYWCPVCQPLPARGTTRSTAPMTRPRIRAESRA